MKKRLLFISVFLLIVTIIVCASKDTGSSALVAGAEKIEKVKAKTQPLLKDFVLYFEGEPLPFDAESKTFYLPVDMEKSEWESGSFTGAFYENADAVYAAADEADGFLKKEREADLFFEESYKKTDKAEALRTGRSFRFLAFTKDGYGEYALVFTGLPMITFNATQYAADDGSQMFYLRAYNTDHSGDWVDQCYTQSRLRGNTSLNYEKKSLRLYLKDLKDDGAFEKQNKNLLGLRDDDDWILNALYADNTRIRDKLCIDLWNEVGAGNNPYGQSFGTKAEMVEVLIGNGYQGIYDLMVPIDAKQLGMDAVSDQLAAGAPVVERIYKKKYTAGWNPADFTGALPDADQPDYRGGFYLKGDTLLQNEEEWKPLADMATLLAADDETFAAGITELADEQNLIDNWLFYQAIAGFDNQNKNYYYVTKNRGGASYGYFIPWDMNLSFGAVYADNAYYCDEKEAAVLEMTEWEPAQRLLALDVGDALSLAAATWNKWREGAFSDEALQARIAELEHSVKDSGAFARENTRWPDGNQNTDFSFLYDFASARMEVVDAYLSALTGNTDNIQDTANAENAEGAKNMEDAGNNGMELQPAP